MPVQAARQGEGPARPPRGVPPPDPRGRASRCSRARASPRPRSPTSRRPQASRPEPCTGSSRASRISTARSTARISASCRVAMRRSRASASVRETLLARSETSTRFLTVAPRLPADLPARGGALGIRSEPAPVRRRRVHGPGAVRARRRDGRAGPRRPATAPEPRAREQPGAPLALASRRHARGPERLRRPDPGVHAARDLLRRGARADARGGGRARSSSAAPAPPARTSSTGCARGAMRWRSCTAARTRWTRSRPTSSTSTPIPTTRARSRRRSQARAFEVVVATYGRLREVSRACVGTTERFVAVGGVPLYRGWMRPEDLAPRGLPVPVREDAPQVESAEELRKGFMIRRTEEAVFDRSPDGRDVPLSDRVRAAPAAAARVVHRAAHARRAARDRARRRRLTLSTAGYTENLAHAVLLAVDRPDAAAGQSYNCGDEQTLTLRQRVESIARILGASDRDRGRARRGRAAGVAAAHPRGERPPPDGPGQAPARARLPRRGAGAGSTAPHRRVAGREPARAGRIIEQILGDTFDYDAEDRLIAAAREGLERMRAVRYAQRRRRRGARTSRRRTARSRRAPSATRSSARAARRSRGRPSPRSPMMLRWMFEAPPAIAGPSEYM